MYAAFCAYAFFTHRVLQYLPQSQAAEGEFAFVIAVFAKDQNLISADLYASIVLAVLISTIIPPFALRYTISYYNKMAERMVKQAEELERQRASTIDPKLSLTPQEKEQRLMVRSNLWTYYEVASFAMRCCKHLTLLLSSFTSVPNIVGKHQGEQDCFSLYSDSMCLYLGPCSKNYWYSFQTGARSD